MKNPKENIRMDYPNDPAICEHKRKSTNRTPLVVITWCMDCGKILKTRRKR